MRNSENGFLKGRFGSIKFAVRGMWLLITTEDSIKAQLFFSLIATFLGFYFSISKEEWMLQCLVIGLVLVAEALNTAVEKLADFTHSEYHKKIGFIKDIAAGASAFAVIIGLIIGSIIYVPKFVALF